jgi:hypothetical protein
MHFFPCLFFKYGLGRFSVRGVQKHHKHVFARSPCRKLFPKNPQKLRCQFPPDFFCFITFPGVSQRREFEALKKRFARKKRQIYPDLFYHVFARFSVRGVQKHDENREKS